MSKLDFSLLVLLSLSFIINSSYGYNLNSTTTTCPWYTCGNDVTIRYPFWEINASTPNHCGYPQFGLSCSATGGEPMLNLSPNETYYVKDINYTDYTLTLVDADVVDVDCPRARHNISLYTAPLNYSPSNLNLSFFFNCTAPNEGLSHIECLGLGYGGQRSYVFVAGKELKGYDWWRNCETKVVTTVMEDEISNGDLIGKYCEIVTRSH